MTFRSFGVLSLFPLLVACGPDDSGDESPTPEPATPTPEDTPVPSWDCVQGCDTLQLIGAGTRNGYFGWAVSQLSDIDDDGITDFMVGSPQNAAGGNEAGALEVYSGASGALLFDFLGETRDFLGWSMADAGDVDGDGIHDMITGAPAASGGGAGRALLYSGATGEVLKVWEGEAQGDFFGYAVASAGDINGDGFDDVVVGAPQYDAVTGVDAGRVYVFSGKDWEVLRTLDGDQKDAYLGRGTAHMDDLDGDGVDELIVGAPGGLGTGAVWVISGATGTALFTFQAEFGALAYGDFFVADVGDVNADGTPDIYVGDYAHAQGDGRVYVYSGLDGAVLYRFNGRDTEGLGCGRGAGDVNGDGFADLATGAYTSSEGANNAGKVYIRSGADGSTLREITSTRANEQLGFDVVGLGDVNGDGVPDVLAAAPLGERVYVISGVVPGE